MLRIFQLFIDIALWRNGPQDVPASTSLLKIALVWYLGSSYVLARLIGLSVPVSLALTVLDVAVTFGWLMMILSVMGFRPRLQQSMIALLGVGTLLTLLNIMVLGVSILLGIPLERLGSWLLLHLMLGLLTYGRIVSITIERSLFIGMALTFAMIVLSEMMQHMVKPIATVAAP